ncbi:FkbM family methyltransferase [Sphingobacterium shayense]|uniref:FkbM family methyltransferase n=1 Tax=Sphingobacterium shayense TaxID=626343 RepID=UPI0015548CBC|nr:FkbM family methyltransferase [Sphingobacterium shayense]NQD71002.1 FkbM family methyltransferase [Sphingobacterium shayense]
MERNNKLKRLEYWIKARIGLIAYIKTQKKIDKEWYGNEYGGFYLNPNLICENSIIYSFGVGEDISFDQSIIKRHQCQVYAFDPTPKSINWISKQQLPETFHFFPYGIGNKTELVKFHLPKNKDHVSGSIFKHHLVDIGEYISVPLKSFADIIVETGHQEIDVLKMDIEGSEYVVMEDILKSNIPIKQILLETHERFFIDGKTKGRMLFALMEKYGYKIFAISDTYQEISFIKTERNSTNKATS